MSLLRSCLWVTAYLIGELTLGISVGAAEAPKQLRDLIDGAKKEGRVV